MKIVWSPLSLLRMQEIADYIAVDNKAAAQNWIDSVFEKAGLLEFTPEIGRIVPEIGRPDIREIIYDNYRIIYTSMPKKIAVLTIRHFKQILPLNEIFP